MKRHSRSRFVAGALVLAALIVSLAAPSQLLLAHERVTIGPYVVVVGWVTEPAVVGERNALFLEFSEDDVPVAGVEGTLDAELLYGGQSFRANLIPTPIPGQYTVDLFPTVRGQYSLRLFGAIGDLAVDEVVEPEEVFTAARIQFPEAQPSLRELQRETQQEIEALAARLQTAQLIAYGGLAVGILGVALALWSARRGR